MAITSMQSCRNGPVTIVRVVSDLSGAVRYHWYRDGSYCGRTAAPRKTFYLASGQQARIDCVDSTDPGFHPFSADPDGRPARRMIRWIRSQADDVSHYTIEQQKNGGDWQQIGMARHEPGTWEYAAVTPRLDDLADYAWRVTAVSRTGNPSLPTLLATERIVRTPDAPAFALTVNTGPTVTIGAAP